MQASFDQVHYAVTPKIKHMYNLLWTFEKCIYLTAVTWANIYLYFWIVCWLKFSKGQEETKKKFFNYCWNEDRLLNNVYTCLKFYCDHHITLNYFIRTTHLMYNYDFREIEVPHGKEA